MHRHIDEKDWLRQLQDGDEDAFTKIYDCYWQPLFVVASHKTGNLAEAEEIVQDIFLDLWRRREELDITTGLSAYLSTCVKYKVLNVLAKRQQALRYSKYASHTLRPEDHSTEDWLQFEQLKAQLAEATAKLPEKCRMVFQLSREKGFSQKQIALHLGVSEKTVESHLTKALRVLRNSLGQLLCLLPLFLGF
jgi:RNA polymerase sigma-70 factor (ECF subfamily)